MSTDVKKKEFQSFFLLT